MLGRGLLGNSVSWRRGGNGGGAAGASPDERSVRADRVTSAADVAWVEAVAFLLPPATFLAGLGDLGAAE